MAPPIVPRAAAPRHDAGSLPHPARRGPPGLERGALAFAMLLARQARSASGDGTAHAQAHQRGSGADGPFEPDDRVRPDGESRGSLSSAAFVPPLPVLLAPMGAAAVPTSVGSGTDRAALAALADRLVQSLAVGRVGSRGHEVRLRLRPWGPGEPLEVRLRADGATLSATLVGGAASEREADALAARLRGELRRRGIALDSVEVQLADGRSTP